MSASPTDPTRYVVGQKIDFHFHPGIIVASYFVSLVGAITTVELLHRRKGGKGWRSWLQSAVISVAFGLVAIWCMHFVGNRAILLGDERTSIQLYYNPGWTAFSAVLPIMFLFIGMTMTELRQPGQPLFWPCLIIASVIAGLAITGMHYVGNLGITNYRVHNPVPFVVGAALLAIGACIVALTLFFYFREHWINSLPRRLLCAVLLACAVSGMHWLATVGTSYTLISLNTSHQTDRDTNMIVAIVICLIACVSCLIIGFLTQLRKRQLEDRAQHVVLASATFDPEGRMMVTQEGLMPCQKVTKQYNQRSFNDEFNTSHSVFQWLYRVTHNWNGVSELIPAMRVHLRATGGSTADVTHIHTPISRPGWEDSSGEEDYSVIFRELFCVAAADLADTIGAPLEKVGTLHNEILMTGNLASEFRPKSKVLRRGTKEKDDSDVESGIIAPTMFGRGQLLFLVRRADQKECSRMMQMGYRFAHANVIGDKIARSMQISSNELISTIEHLKISQRHTDSLPMSGTILSCFAVRAALKGSNSSWEVLVNSDNTLELPQVRLSSEQLKPYQMDILRKMDGHSVNQCLQYLINKPAEIKDEEELEFMEHLHDRINALKERVSENFFAQAVFSARPVSMPTSNTGDATAEKVSMFAFCIIPDVHVSSIKSRTRLKYVPLSFFRCGQRVYRNSPDHQILARNIHREFGAILLRKDYLRSRLPVHTPTPKKASRAASMTRKSMWKFSSPSSPRDSMVYKADSSSERELVDSASAHKEVENTTSHAPFGGIMVSEEITVDANSKEDNPVELRDLGIKSEAGQGAIEQPTYVDRLFEITRSQFSRP